MNIKIISENKKAYHDYEILETLEAGIVLVGAEIKAIRNGKINLTGSHARMFQTKNAKLKTNNKIETPNPELFLLGAHINAPGVTPERDKKLLLHKNEINKLLGKTQQKTLTMIPLKLYLKKGRAKVEIALARGKKLHDKRETIKKKDIMRSKQQGFEV